MMCLADENERRELVVATLLWYGTLLASVIIAIGIGVGIVQRIDGPLSLGFSVNDIMKVGVALFILLPISRVALLIAIFLRERDYAYVVISSFVLAIIAAGVAVEW
ncbi:DUF1634 domain-containing protein [Dyella sp. 20L07]|uniref:DUF1634 domain-containing protein n=1 Tax=Dyella sp. 20L07 TaxID=3384240 RepID=UPI003D2E6ABD